MGTLRKWSRKQIVLGLLLLAGGLVMVVGVAMCAVALWVWRSR